MAEQLEIIIGAKVDGLKKGLKDSEKALASFKTRSASLNNDLKKNAIASGKLVNAQNQLTKQYKSGAISLNKYESELGQIALQERKLEASSKSLNNQLQRVNSSAKTLSPNISGTGTAATTAGVGMTKLGAGTKGAVPAMTSFSQVIQDAPFGIRGVANNITQLTAQMGHLTKNAGGTKNALKAMLGTLAGPAGILLVISAVTSLMVAYSDKLKFAASATTQLAKASAEFVTDARTEITTLTSLLKIARDMNNSQSVRLKAIKEINDKYSDYLGNLDLDSVKTNKVTNSVRLLTVALLQKAKVEGLEALIKETSADKSEALIKAELERSKALRVLNAEVKNTIVGNKTLNRALGDIKNPREQLEALVKLTQQQGQVGDVARQASVGVGLALQSYKDAGAQVKDLNNELNDALSPLVKLQEQFTKGLFQTESNIAPAFDQDEVVIEAKLKVNEESINAAFDLLKRQSERTNELLGKDAPTIPTQPLLESFGVINNGIKKLGTDYGTALTNIEQKTKRLAEFSVEIGGQIANGFAGIGEAIGGALASGANIANALGGALLGAIGTIAVELGKQAIAIGVGMIAIKSAFANPAAAIAAGVALVAIGSAIKATSATVSGVGASSSSSSTSGSNTSTNYSSTTSGGFEGRVIFEIGGDKLIGVLNNTSLGNLRVGDSDQLITTG